MDKQHHLLVSRDDVGQREFFLEAFVYAIGSDPNCDRKVICGG